MQATVRPAERLAAAYDGAMRPLERLLLRRLRLGLVPALRGRVLEVGAGTGVNLPLYDRSARLVIVDADPAMLRCAAGRALPGQATFVLADAERLPFLPGSFDHAVATLFFCSVGDPAAAAVEICRVLRPGGTLSLLEHMQGAGRLAGWLTRALARPWCAVMGSCHLDRRTLDVLQGAGLLVREERRYLGGIVRTVVLARAG